MKIKINISILLLIISFFSFGQGAGTWKSHLPYHKAIKVCEAGSKIFCVTENSLFYFDKEDNSTNILTKFDGLSDIEITSINYHIGLKKIVLGYKSGFIDIINENLKISSLSDINRTSSVVGSKAITNISFHENTAYLSTDFGVVLLDLRKQEIQETYRNIGPNGEEGTVSNVLIDSKTNLVYTHNEFGICYAPINGKNLLNYQNWTYLKDSLGNNQKTFNHYAVYNDKLVGIKQGDGIYEYSKTENFTKTPYSIITWSPIYSFTVRNNKLVSTYFYHTFVHDKDYKTNDYASDNIVSDGLIDKDGKIWIAENNTGMSTNLSGNMTSVSPSGTHSSLVFGLYSSKDIVISVTGGYNGSFAPNYNGIGFSIFQNHEWKNVNKDLSNSKYAFSDPIDALYDPIRKKYLLAHYISGLVVWDGDTSFTRLTKEDSSSIPFHTISGQTRITSVTMDTKNNIWLTNHLTQGNPSIHKLLPNNTWQSFTLKESKTFEALDLVIDNSDQKWILAKGNSIVVWDEKTNNERTLYNSTGQGNLPSSKINCIERDKKGQIWVGTDKGVAVFTDPSKALSSSFYEATTPIFEKRPLLQDEQVLSIYVDGANRKWFGTSNGAFLFDENGTENIYTFNTKNSLLPSNTIKDITINEVTGEVYFGTSKGIVSFWADATEAKPTYGEAKIFPNPINPNFQGLVSITGLKDNSIVKITDVNGKMVYEQTSNGGSATWNTKTLNGTPVQSGIYLVYSTDEDFTDSFIGKLVIVN
jgi:ligand-binding sensor domain-containing protein